MIARPSLPSRFFVLVLALALPLALLSACATRSSKSDASPGPKETTYFAQPVHPILGRIVSVDRFRGTVVIDLTTSERFPHGLDRRPLLARRDDLTPTAQLTGTPHLRGRTLGARIAVGRPEIGDEVILITTPALP